MSEQNASLIQLGTLRDEIENLEHQGAKTRADLKFAKRRYSRLFEALGEEAIEAGFTSMVKAKKDDDDEG